METIYLAIDESGFDEHSDNAIVGCAEVYDLEKVRDQINNLKQEFLENPKINQLPTIQEFGKSGFHFCSDHIEIQGLFADLLSKLGFRSYICYANKKRVEKNHPEITNAELYKNLFRKVMVGRFQKYQNSKIVILFEPFSNKKNNDKKLIIEAISDVQKYHKKIYGKDLNLSIEVLASEKSENISSIIDYMIGLFGSHINGNPEGSYKERYYNLLADKIGLSVDYFDNGKYSSRHSRS